MPGQGEAVQSHGPRRGQNGREKSLYSCRPSKNCDQTVEKEGVPRPHLSRAWQSAIRQRTPLLVTIAAVASAWSSRSPAIGVQKSILQTVAESGPRTEVSPVVLAVFKAGRFHRSRMSVQVVYSARENLVSREAVKVRHAARLQGWRPSVSETPYFGCASNGKRRKSGVSPTLPPNPRQNSSSGNCAMNIAASAVEAVPAGPSRVSWNHAGTSVCQPIGRRVEAYRPSQLVRFPTKRPASRRGTFINPLPAGTPVKRLAPRVPPGARARHCFPNVVRNRLANRGVAMPPSIEPARHGAP